MVHPRLGKFVGAPKRGAFATAEAAYAEAVRRITEALTAGPAPIHLGLNSAASINCCET